MTMDVEYGTNKISLMQIRFNLDTNIYILDPY